MTMDLLKKLAKQVIGSMAVAIVLYIVIREISRYAVGEDQSAVLDDPLFMTVLAVIAFPFIRKFMK